MQIVMILKKTEIILIYNLACLGNISAANLTKREPCVCCLAINLRPDNSTDYHELNTTYEAPTKIYPPRSTSNTRLRKYRHLRVLYLDIQQ